MTIQTRREKRDLFPGQLMYSVIPVQAAIYAIKVLWDSFFRTIQSHCDLQGNLTRLFSLALLVIMFGACASSSTVAPGKRAGAGFEVIPVEKASLFSKPPADAMLLNEGASWLGLSDKPADYVKARETFVRLMNNYPKSKWRPLAETFIHLIDTIQTEQAKNQSERELAENLQRDKEQLRKDLQLLNSKCQADRTGLLQENEQLKRDMELLKKLEVQLDRREKMLR